MNPTSNVEYRGTQGADLISQPTPPNRTADRDRRADSILAKDPEDRRVDPKTNQLKVAADFRSWLEKDAARIVRPKVKVSKRKPTSGKKGGRNQRRVQKAREEARKPKLMSREDAAKMFDKREQARAAKKPAPKAAPPKSVAPTPGPSTAVTKRVGTNEAVKPEVIDRRPKQEASKEAPKPKRTIDTTGRSAETDAEKAKAQTKPKEAPKKEAPKQEAPKGDQGAAGAGAAGQQQQQTTGDQAGAAGDAQQPRPTVFKDKHGNPVQAAGNDVVFDAGTGQFMLRDTPDQPYRFASSASDRDILNRQMGELSPLQMHEIGVQSGLRQDTFGNRLKAHAANIAGGNNFASQMLTSTVGMGAANAALGMIPAGTDEYGNRQTLADTAVGQMASPIIGIMGAQAVPGAVANMTRHRAGSIANMQARAGGNINPTASPMAQRAGSAMSTMKQKMQPQGQPTPNLPQPIKPDENMKVAGLGKLAATLWSEA